MSNHQQPDGRGSIPGALEQLGRREPSPTPSRAGLADCVQWVMMAVLILALSYLLWRGVHVLLLAFAGLLFALFLSALSEWLSRRTGLPYSWALATVVIVLALMAGCFGWLLASRLASQVAELSQKLPQSLQQIHDDLEASRWGRLLLEKAPQAAETFAQAGAISRVTGVFSGVANFLMYAVVIVFVGIFGAAEPDVYKNGLLHLVPPHQRQRVAQTLDAVVFNLRWWLVGQVFLMVTIGVTTWLGLWLLAIPLALTLGLIAGILELIPYVGPWLAAVPAALIALPLGPGHVVTTLALYLGLHILEGYVLMPLVQRRALHLPPALTLIAQLLLGELLGVLGLFVAAPLTVSAIVFLKMLYVEDALGDNTVEVPGEARKGTSPTPSNLPSS